MTLIELKAAAYDTLAQIEFFQRTLAELNNEIANYQQQNKTEMKNLKERPLRDDGSDLPSDEPPTVPPVKPKE
jgi:hypothetical protein